MELPATPSSAWYALWVKPRCEKAVAGDLELRGIPQYLPLYEKLTQWSDRAMRVCWPLFPCYVFARLVPAQRLPALRHPHVRSIVSSAGVAQPVDPLEIEAVRTMLEASRGAEPVPFLEIGEQVEVIRGVLAGMRGILLRDKGRDRLVVSLTLLQRSVATEIDRHDLRPAPAHGLYRAPARLVSAPILGPALGAC
jgi:transcription antitermination factor NusG